ncbi:MAG: GntR family transcriptional regulator [Rhodospirillales bacterium]
MQIRKPTSKESVADRAYREIRELAMMYKLRPGESLNEVELAQRLNVSRTPLREALNRLASEGFFTFEARRGFRSRSFEVRELVDLYELRSELEVFATKLAIERASDERISELESFCRNEGAKRFGADMMAQLDVDELFHERLAALSDNGEVVRMLKNINGRIRFARWVDMDGRLRQTDSEHLQIIESVRQRDEERCQHLVAGHISRRVDQIREVIKEGFARIFIEEIQA